ncbi:MAG: formyl transferase [Acidimicrobiales bacterium]
MTSANGSGAPGGRGARVVLLATRCPAADVIYHALRAAVGPLDVVLEQRVPRSQFLRRRVRRLGLRTVAGQVLFMATVVPVLERRGRRRSAEILELGDLRLAPIPEVYAEVQSANSDEARALLQELGPSIVVVAGTRILSKATLACVDAPFVNLHMGITPCYRGVHGGYWALAEGRPDMAGSTVHMIDAGIDTGAVLRQATFKPEPEDSFVTYVFHHLAVGVPILVETVQDMLADHTWSPPSTNGTGGESRLRTHPTLWSYLATRRRMAVR